MQITIRKYFLNPPWHQEGGGSSQLKNEIGDEVERLELSILPALLSKASMYGANGAIQIRQQNYTLLQTEFRPSFMSYVRVLRKVPKKAADVNQ